MNKNTFKNLIVVCASVLISAVFHPVANAQASADSKLKIEGDLMIHPDQMANFFQIGADKIKASEGWSWPSMSFTKPYKTSWDDVMAIGPFDIQFDTSNLGAQDFSFELAWNNPKISVGRFEIHDTLTKIIGGIPVIFHLDGVCEGMALNIPGGQWKVRGSMRWDFTQNKFVLTWREFNLSMNAGAQPNVDVGRCTGPSNLVEALKEAMLTISKDRTWLEDVLKQGALDWLQSSLGVLQEQLLVPRNIQVSKDIVLGWKPASLVSMQGGLIRVAGNFEISKPGSKVGDSELLRDYDPNKVLSQVKESGFVMPQNSLQKILGYMYSNHELQYRVKSTAIQSFTDLMGNRLMQFFVWPDLMKFAKNTLFYFDITTGGEPRLADGSMLPNGGSVYNISAPLLVHQWAPGTTAYVPYVDFTGAAKGQVYASLKDGELKLQTKLAKLDVNAGFRSEFQIIRRITNRISASLLGSRAKDFLNEKPLTLKLPDWDFSHGLSIGIRDVQAHKDSFRIPLDFKGKP